MISRKSPGLSLVPPSGPLMKVWNAQPARKSKARTSVTHGFGHHHSFRTAGSLQARQTFLRGALTKRSMTRSSFASVIVGVLQPLIHAIEPRFPEGTLFGEPGFGSGKPPAIERAGAHA